MGASLIFLILALVPCTLSASLIKETCETGDNNYNLECAVEVLRQFFRDCSAGVPEHHLNPTDPITIPNFKTTEDKVGFTSEYKNIKVTGFKDVTISDLSVKVEPKITTAHFKTKFVLSSEGDIVVKLKSGKTFSGTFKYGGNIEGDTTYTFTQWKENDKKFFNVNPEITTCKADDIKPVLSQELEEAIDKDPECQAMVKDFEKVASRHYEKTLCKMAAVVFQTAIENIRIHVRAGI